MLSKIKSVASLASEVSQQHCRGRSRQAEAADPSGKRLQDAEDAYAMIKGFEVMRALRKSQAGIFNITRDICGEARLVERAFGLGASVLAEAVQFVGEWLDLEAA